jgi:hypothetical protein
MQGFLYNKYMTIVEAANKLLEHFIKKDSFCMETDYIDLMQLSENPEENKITFILALEDLEKNDIIKGYIQGKKRIYILKKPLNSFEQNINVGGFTCNMIAKVINDFCDKIKDKRDYCDSRNITEKDIRNLMFIATMHSENQNKID